MAYWVITTQTTVSQFSHRHIRRFSGHTWQAPRLEEGLTHLLSGMKRPGSCYGPDQGWDENIFMIPFQAAVWRSCIIIYLKRIENILKIHGCNSRMTYKVSKNFWQILAQAHVTQSTAEIYKTLHKQQYWSVSTSSLAFFSWDWRLDWRKCFGASS